MKTFDSGAKSSEAAPRIDLVPLASLLRQAARMAQGAASHGPRNYERGVDDPAFVRDRKNHLVLHALRYLADDRTDDHLGAILANAGMLARLEEMHDSQILSDIASEKHIHVSANRGNATPGCPFSAAITPNRNTPDHEQATYASVQDATVFSMADPLTYDEKRAAAQSCLGGCGFIIQNATTCHTCRSRQNV